jgi:hypothetical protein
MVGNIWWWPSRGIEAVKAVEAAAWLNNIVVVSIWQ